MTKLKPFRGILASRTMHAKILRGLFPYLQCSLQRRRAPRLSQFGFRRMPIVGILSRSSPNLANFITQLVDVPFVPFIQDE